MKTRLIITAAFLVSWFGIADGRAEAVKNGNEACLQFSQAAAAAKTQIQQARTGVYHVFRFLKITEIGLPDEKSPFARLLTTEPSSDMRVMLVCGGKISLKLARELKAGDYVAVRGRVKSVGVEAKDLMVVDPAMLQFKDRSTPKAGMELLSEVDPSAH